MIPGQTESSPKSLFVDIEPADIILVTGACGYLSGHILYLLLANDYKVRGLVTPGTNPQSYAFLFDSWPTKAKNIEIVTADLKDVNSLAEVMKGCQYIIHVPSSCPLPQDPKEAKQITNNILKAALWNSVRRVVLTSDVNTMILGHHYDTVNEDYWANERDCEDIHKAQIVIEKTAWEFYNKNKDIIELVVVNPGLIIGPTLGKTISPSAEIFVRALKGELQGYPWIGLPVVDVRDVAIAHLRALKLKEANGKRHIIANKTLKIEEMLHILRDEFSKHGYSIVERQVSKLPFKLVSFFDPTLKSLVPMLDHEYRVDNSRSLKELSMFYRSVEESIVEMAYNLIDRQIVPDRIHQHHSDDNKNKGAERLDGSSECERQAQGQLQVVQLE